jgi:fructose-specific phosphotransferase system IIC component
MGDNIQQKNVFGANSIINRPIQILKSESGKQGFMMGIVSGIISGLLAEWIIRALF